MHQPTQLLLEWASLPWDPLHRRLHWGRAGLGHWRLSLRSSLCPMHMVGLHAIQRLLHRV